MGFGLAGLIKKGEKPIYANGRIWQDADLYWNRRGGSWTGLFSGWQDPLVRESAGRYHHPARAIHVLFPVDYLYPYKCYYNACPLFF